MIHLSYSALRANFAVTARTSAVSLTYVAGSPATITRAAGSFVTDGFVAGMSVDVSGTVSNDARYTIDTVAALTLTLSSADTLIAEGPVVSSLYGAFYELDGSERWPIELVRASGFDAGATILSPPVTALPFDITINGNLTDAADGDSYDWYVSQRSDDASRQFFSISHPDATKSGTIRFTITAVGVIGLGLSPIGPYPIDTTQRDRAFRKVFAFVRRVSDGAIQIVWMERLVNAESAA